MLFFFNYSFTYIPIGQDRNRIYTTVSLTSTLLNNKFYIIN